MSKFRLAGNFWWLSTNIHNIEPLPLSLFVFINFAHSMSDHEYHFNVAMSCSGVYKTNFFPDQTESNVNRRALCRMLQCS